MRPPRPARQPAVRRLSLPGPTGLGGRSVVSTMAGPALGSDTGLALQLLQLLETENARLEAALEWRRRELVFWQWMVRRHPPPPPACPSPLHPSPPVPPLPFPSPALPWPRQPWTLVGLPILQERREVLGMPPRPTLKPVFHLGLGFRVWGSFQTSVCPISTLPSYWGDPDSSGGLSLLEVWPLCVPGIQAPWGEGRSSPFCGLGVGAEPCSLSPLAGEPGPWSRPGTATLLLTEVSPCRTQSWMPAPRRTHRPRFCPGSLSQRLEWRGCWRGSCRPCKRSCGRRQKPGGLPGRLR